MNTSVLKFGGSTFTSLDSYTIVASYLGSKKQNNEKPVIVVSAMSGTTGRLKETAASIDTCYRSEVGDQLLSTGEMVSMALLRIACEKIGLKTNAMTGYEMGIRTDGRFGRAKVIALENAPLVKSVEKNDITILCGGQGITDENKIAMLGRNSSDLTAILAASMLGIKKCQIFSDVPGVYTVDPHIVPNAKCISRISYDQAIMLSRSGAKVLHQGCIEKARELTIAISCCMLDKGNSVIQGSQIQQNGTCSAVVVAKGAIRIRPDSASDIRGLSKFLDARHLNYHRDNDVIYVIDPSITEYDRIEMAPKYETGIGWLITLVAQDKIIRTEFTASNGRAWDIAHRIHQDINLHNSNYVDQKCLYKSHSEMSDLLLGAV